MLLFTNLFDHLVYHHIEFAQFYCSNINIKKGEMKLYHIKFEKELEIYVELLLS